MSPTDDPRPFAPPNPGANALKTGTLADLPRVPEDAAAVNARTLDWYPCHMPQHHFHCWLVEQISVLSVRIEHNGRVERRMRDRSALRAEIFWDDDRHLEATLLGERLSEKPESIARQLRRTPQGCDWMIDRWARLARIADQTQTWNDAQHSLAFDLLGTRPEDRNRPIGETLDRDGRLVETLDDLAALARREIAALLRRQEEVAGPDALDRALAQSDYIDEPTPEVRQLRRRDTELHRRLKWYLERIDHKSPYKTNTRMDAHFEPLADTVPQPEAEVPAPPPESEANTPEPEPEPESGETLPQVISVRQEERSKKVEARREARRRKLDRRRA